MRVGQGSLFDFHTLIMTAVLQRGIYCSFSEALDSRLIMAVIRHHSGVAIGVFGLSLSIVSLCYVYLPFFPASFLFTS